VQALAFWKAVVADRLDLIERVASSLADARIAFCVVGGQAVNAYVDPLVSLDLDLAVSADPEASARALTHLGFRLERQPHSLNLSHPESNLRVPIQTDVRYAAFVDRAVPRSVLGLTMPVAAVEDVLRGKVWAAQDAARRPSKRQKDFADIARLLEAFPYLRADVPAEILSKLV
jgi:hypothetical protein